MKTSELRLWLSKSGELGAAGFSARHVLQGNGEATALEVIRLREALAEAINLAEGVAAMPLPARATADLRALLAEHDE